MEIQDIVVPVDGSRLAEHALPTAVSIARRTGACVRLVAVVPGASFMDPIDLPDAVSTGLKRSHAWLSRYVDDLLARLRRIDRVRTTGEVHVDAPVEGVLHAIEKHHAGLVVMTSHGRGGIQRAWLGSTADAVIRRAEVPVIVIKPESDVEVDLRTLPVFGSVLVPLDGSETAESALDPAITLASLFGGAVTLLRVALTPYEVYPLPRGVASDFRSFELVRESERAAEYLAGVAQRLRRQGTLVNIAIVETDGVAEAIMEQARHGGGSLIALATHGLGGVRRLLIGSVTDKVLRKAGVPVLVIRPTQVEEKVEAAAPLPQAFAMG